MLNTSVRTSILRDRTVATIAAATAVTIKLASSQVKVRVRRVKLKRVAGTAANFTPFLSRSATGLIGDMNKVWAGAATAVANLVDSTPTEGVETTDANGQLYLICGPDAGADNTFDYFFAFEILA